MKGMALADNGDLLVVPRTGKDNRLTGLVVDDTLIQCAALVLEMNQGELKEDPVLGANLMRYMRSRADKAGIEKQMRVHLRRAGIEWSELTERISIVINNN